MTDLEALLLAMRAADAWHSDDAAQAICERIIAELAKAGYVIARA
jgi:hypothetical protein